MAGKGCGEGMAVVLHALRPCIGSPPYEHRITCGRTLQRTRKLMAHVRAPGCFCTVPVLRTAEFLVRIHSHVSIAVCACFPGAKEKADSLRRD